MPTMTLSIPPELYRKMKEHPEIKWSEVARKAIAEYIREIENARSEMSMGEFRELLNEKILSEITSIPNETYEMHYKKARGLEWERTESFTTRTS